MVQEVHGTIVECNTAYGDASDGVRDNTESHRKLLEEHRWTKFFPVDLLDAEGPDLVWPIPNGKILNRTWWARTSSTTTPCWCWPTSRATPWAATAGPSNSCPSAAPPGRARP